MDQLKDQQPAKIVFRSQPTSEFEGVVARLESKLIVRLEKFTSMFELCSFQYLAIGQRAEVFIETARVDDCVWIPASFLEKRNAEQGVYVDQSSVANGGP